MKQKRKRTAEEANLNITSSDELSQLCNEIKTADVVELTKVAELKTLLRKLAKEDNGISLVQNAIDDQLITSLLVAYGAQCNEKDTKIYSILEKLERKFMINLSSLQPLVFGGIAKEHYQKLASLGSTLHRILPNQVLGYLDPQITWSTMKNHSKDDFPGIYDVRFMMRLFASILQPGSEELKEEKFNEKALYVYVIRLFKQSITTEAPRISHLISHFLARVSKLLLHPESPAYGQVLGFLCQKPQIDLNNIPDFYRMFFSTSVEFYKDERDWILQLIAEAIIDPIDYNVLQKRSGVKLLLALFNTCLVDQPVRKHILAILKSSVKISSAAFDLFYRCNLQSWIALTIKNARLTRWERNYLAQIFVILLRNQRAYQQEKGIVENDISLTIAKLTAKSVINVLKELEESEAVSTSHLEAIEAYFAE